MLRAYICDGWDFRGVSCQEGEDYFEAFDIIIEELIV